MGKRMDFNNKLNNICATIASIDYVDLQNEFQDEFNSEKNYYINDLGGFGIEDRLIKFNTSKTFDSATKELLISVVTDLKVKDFVFSNDDINRLNTFSKKIDGVIHLCQYMTNIFNGPNNFVKGHSLDIVTLFNDFKKYESFEIFSEKTNIDKAFIENLNFKSYLIYLFSICRNCINPDTYPVYYKYYQNIANWCFNIEHLKYDDFCNFYRSLDSLGAEKSSNYNFYFYLLGLKIKKELINNNLVNTVADVNYVNNNLFNYPDDKLNFKLMDEDMNVLEQFDIWIDNLSNYKTSSKNYCKRDIRKVQEISIKNELGDITDWDENDWSLKENVLRELPEILENNSPKGSGWYSASLSKFKEFLNSNDIEVSDIPIIPFDKFGWRWATTGISSKLNYPVSLFAVLDAILINGNGAYNKTEVFKNTIKTICINKYEIDDEDLIETLTRLKNPDVKKNIIENSGNYWSHLGLINPSGQNAVVTELGKQFLKGEVSKDEFVSNLINNYKLPSPVYDRGEINSFEINKIEIFPFRIILDVFEELNSRNISDEDKYMTEDDLKKIIVPFSINYNSNLKSKLVDIVLDFRITPEKYKDWPNCYSHYGDDKGDRMINEYLFFLEAFDFLNSNLGINTVRSATGAKKYFAAEKFQSLFSFNNGSLNNPNINYNIDMEMMKNYNDILTAIQTKPFILLAGISGTGKSRLVRLLAFNSCNNEELRGSNNKPGNYELIPVKPNWHDSSEIIGYVSRINGEKYIPTDFLKFIVKAWKYSETPFFLCLDEMNLAPVEQYFAEYLSIIETRSSKTGKIETDSLFSHESLNILNSQSVNIYHELLKNLLVDEGSELWNQFIKNGIQIPPNLVVIGTVNMDETTHSFSRKVLDRAMTFEMNHVNLNDGLELAINELSYPSVSDCIPLNNIVGNLTTGAEVYNEFELSKDVIKYLEDINIILESSPFKIAYRVRDEFLIYCYYNHLKEGKLKDALDSLTSMKILSRIEGDENKTEKVLNELKSLFESNEFTDKSLPKIEEMQKRLNYGYTSFWN
jgi:5-methylcytosine-specific restriction protein B